MLVGTKNTSEQFITKLAVNMDIYGKLEISMDGNRIFNISMDMVDIHLKVEYLKQEKPLMESSPMELTLYSLI